MAAKTQKTNTTSADERTADATRISKKKLIRSQEIAVATKSLKPLARTINTKLKSVAKLEGKVDDTRLAACVAIAQAAQIAKEGHVAFKTWCEENITELGYQSLRKMRPIGEAELAEKGKGLAMLQEMRSKNAQANRKARANASAAKGAEGAENPPANTDGTRPTDLAASIREIFNKLDPDAQTHFAQWAAEQCGLKVS